MANSIIKLEGVNFYYDRGRPSEVLALNNANLEINRGEYVAFFGPSGCGKTTLLYIIAGIEMPDNGQVLINGRDLTKLSKKELAIYRQIGIGIIFQQFNLIPSISVLDNIALPMAFLGISAGKRKEEAIKLLERLGIGQLAKRLPSELSGGQQQRVGIARALANNPPIILADEPLGNLDSDNAQKVLEVLRELNLKDGRTIIMVTHEAWSLRDIDRVYYMRDGAITRTEERRAPEVKKVKSTYFYKKLFPELPSIEIRSKAIANLLLRGYSEEEIKRFEFFLTQRLKDQIDTEIFEKVLDRPFKDSGVGLWRPKAKKIAAAIESMIKEGKIIESIYKKLEANPATPLAEEIAQIRRWLLKDYKGNLTYAQVVKLDEIIDERIRNVINSDHFQKIANLSKKQNGIGLSLRLSAHLTDRLEAITGGKLTVAPETTI